MNLFICRENNASFLRYLDLHAFVKSTNFKVCDVVIETATNWKLQFCLFLLNPQYYENENWSNTNVSYNKHF